MFYGSHTFEGWETVVLTEVLLVNVPGSVTLPVTKNVLALEIPATVNSPLKGQN